MPEEKQCQKCGKKESEARMPFMSPYRLCNECHSAFLPYIHDALLLFLQPKKKK